MSHEPEAVPTMEEMERLVGVLRTEASIRFAGMRQSEERARNNLLAAISVLHAAAVRGSEDRERIVTAFDEWYHHGSDSLLDTTAQAWERLERAIKAARGIVNTRSGTKGE